MNLENPWIDLPHGEPFILGEDLKVIGEHKNFLGLRLDTLPEPFIGGLDKAKIVFLALNPGFNETDVTVNMKLPKFLEGRRHNLNDPYGSGFYYFGGGLETTGGYKWWASKLKPLVRAGVDETMLKEKIMVIEYFPYHSLNYHHINAFTPSQLYSFELVKEAMRRNKLIIVMRSKALWEAAIPELAKYPYMTLNSPQNVTISTKNVGELNFRTLLAELKQG